MNDKNIDDFSCLFLKILSGYVIVLRVKLKKKYHTISVWIEFQSWFRIFNFFKFNNENMNY